MKVRETEPESVIKGGEWRSGAVAGLTSGQLFATKVAPLRRLAGTDKAEPRRLLTYDN